MKQSAYPLGFGAIQSMYGAAKAHSDSLDRPPDLKNRGFSEAVGADIDLGRERTLAGCQQILVLQLGSSPAGLGSVVVPQWSGPPPGVPP